MYFLYMKRPKELNKFANIQSVDVNPLSIITPWTFCNFVKAFASSH